MKWAAVVILTLVSCAVAQDDVHIVPRDKAKSKSVEATPFIRVDVDLAIIPVIITDPSGRPFPGLVKEHFKLTYDGQEQEIKHFSQDDSPISIGLILDRSGSMNWKLERAKMIVQKFARQVNQQDEIFLITFADTIDATDFQSVTENIENRVNFVISNGRTSLLDAIYLGITKMKDAKYQRRALIIITDGGENHSRYTAQEIKRLLEEADTQIFTIGLYNPQCLVPDVPGLSTNTCSFEERFGPDLLRELAEKAGGLPLFVQNSQEIDIAVNGISHILRQEYILGFTPKSKVPKDGKFHKLKIKLQRLPKGTPTLRVDARQGLYAQSK